MAIARVSPAFSEVGSKENGAALTAAEVWVTTSCRAVAIGRALLPVAMAVPSSRISGRTLTTEAGAFSIPPKASATARSAAVAVVNDTTRLSSSVCGSDTSASASAAPPETSLNVTRMRCWNRMGGSAPWNPSSVTVKGSGCPGAGGASSVVRYCASSKPRPGYFL